MVSDNKKRQKKHETSTFYLFQKKHKKHCFHTIEVCQLAVIDVKIVNHIIMANKFKAKKISL